MSPDVLLVYSWDNCNVYKVDLTTKKVEQHAQSFGGGKGTEIKELPGYNAETYPFVFIRDKENICLLNTKEKNKVYKLIDIAPEGNVFNNRMAVTEDG